MHTLLVTIFSPHSIWIHCTNSLNLIRVSVLPLLFAWELQHSVSHMFAKSTCSSNLSFSVSKIENLNLIDRCIKKKDKDMISALCMCVFCFSSLFCGIFLLVALFFSLPKVVCEFIDRFSPFSCHASLQFCVIFGSMIYLWMFLSLIIIINYQPFESNVNITICISSGHSCVDEFISVLNLIKQNSECLCVDREGLREPVFLDENKRSMLCVSLL